MLTALRWLSTVCSTFQGDMDVHVMVAGTATIIEKKCLIIGERYNFRDKTGYHGKRMTCKKTPLILAFLLISRK